MSSIRPFSYERIPLPSGLELEASLSVPEQPDVIGTQMHAPVAIDTAPSNGPGSRSTEKKLAVCLHPWSWLGGRMDDPVLLTSERAFLRSGYHVLRYNSRGVGNSSGWPSFTGLTEGQDLQDIIHWALSKIKNIGSIVIMGYSHGALIASLFPILPEPIKVSHILLSYPLGPRTWLTAFHSGTYSTTLNSLLQHPRSNVLIVFGDRDEFTAEASYDTWVEELRKQGSGAGMGHLEIAKMEGATHFWTDEENARRRLVQKILEWVS